MGKVKARLDVMITALSNAFRLNEVFGGSADGTGRYVGGSDLVLFNKVV